MHVCVHGRKKNIRLFAAKLLSAEQICEREERWQKPSTVYPHFANFPLSEFKSVRDTKVAGTLRTWCMKSTWRGGKMKDFVYTTTGNWFHLIIYPLQLPKPTISASSSPFRGCSYRNNSTISPVKWCIYSQMCSERQASQSQSSSHAEANICRLSGLTRPIFWRPLQPLKNPRSRWKRG